MVCWAETEPEKPLPLQLLYGTWHGRLPYYTGRRQQESDLYRRDAFCDECEAAMCWQQPGSGKRYRYRESGRCRKRAEPDWQKAVSAIRNMDRQGKTAKSTGSSRSERSKEKNVIVQVSTLILISSDATSLVDQSSAVTFTRTSLE